jgi:phospholipid/cholesterol/gamma-HCH transport system substrate-binding protein
LFQIPLHLKISRETKVGIFAAMAISILYFGFNFLKGKKIFSSYNTYYVMYDNIEGITSSTPVYINGYKVGQVQAIDLADESNPNNIMITVFVQGKIKVSRNTVARIVSQDLLGTKVINLVIRDMNQVLASGDTLLGEREPDLSTSLNNSLSPIKDKSEKVLVTLDKVLSSLQQVFNDKGTERLANGVVDLSEALHNLRNSTEKLDRMIANSHLDKTLANVESITSNLRENNAELAGTLKNLNKITDSLAQSNIKSVVNNINRLSNELAGITEKMNKGEGSLGMMANDKQLYVNLTKSLHELQSLLNDVQKYPGRYVHLSVFGAKTDKAEKKRDADKAAGR